MKGALLEDYNNPTYKALGRSILSSFILENKKIPFIIAIDSSIIHYKPWTEIVFNPNLKSSWKQILEEYYQTDEFKILNEAVAGDALLSKYATIHFLNKLFSSCQNLSNNRSLTIPSSSRDSNPIQVISALDNPNIRPDIKNSAISSIVQELTQEAEEIMKDVEVIQSFSHVGVPVASMLEKPSEFREKARNKIIVNLVKFIKKLRSESPSLKQAKAPTLVGGRPLGVKKIQRWGELVRVLPTEFIDEDIFSYGVASRSVKVYEMYGSIQDYVVYLDKSGSMANSIAYRESSLQISYVPKISFATASALALASKLKSLGAKLTLKLFDVEVHDPITDYKELIETLLKIRADSGTSITRVLEDALHYRDEKIIIITDGIDELDPDAVKKAKSSNLDVVCIFIQTDNELLRKNFPCIHLKEAKPEILLEI